MEKKEERHHTIEALSEFSEDGLLRIAARDFALPSTKIWNQTTTSEIENYNSIK